MAELVLSFIVPCYNEEDIIGQTYKILYNYIQYLVEKDIISPNSYISFIDDGSSDSTWEKIKSFDKVHGIRLIRNFGHQKAIFAGLINNRADIYIPIDADLQDDVNIVEDMIQKYINGAEIVFAKRKKRKNADSFFKIFSAFLFYKILKIINPGTVIDCGDFCLLSEKIIREIKLYSSKNMYLRGLVQSLNYNKDYVEYVRNKRIGSTNKYTFHKSLKLALDAIFMFTAPLSIISFFCIMTSFSLFCLEIVYIIFSVNSNSLSIQEFLGLLLLFILIILLFISGILCEYTGRIYSESKKIPDFLISEEIYSLF